MAKKIVKKVSLKKKTKTFIKKGKRYDAFVLEFDAERIKTFEEIFDHIPKSEIAEKMGITLQTLNKKINNLGLFKLDELITIADILNVDRKKLVYLAAED